MVELSDAITGMKSLEKLIIFDGNTSERANKI